MLNAITPKQINLNAARMAQRNRFDFNTQRFPNHDDKLQTQPKVAQSVFSGSPRNIGLSQQQAGSRLTGIQDTLKSYDKQSVFSAHSAAENFNQGSAEQLGKPQESGVKPLQNQSMAMPSAVTQETSKFNIVVSPTKLKKPSQEQI